MHERFLGNGVALALGDTPVVLINGPRQAGKTTLVREVLKGRANTREVSLDDATTLAAALHDPVAFAGSFDGTLFIDEIQKAKPLLPAIKLLVDDDRRPGRFILTGSANILLLPKIADSLAGRMEIITLRPLAQCEIEGTRPTMIDRLFDGQPPPAMDSSSRPLEERIHGGGYPEALARPVSRRRAWHASYLTAILQRDVKDIAGIEHLYETPRLLSLLAARSGGLLNTADVSRDAGLAYSTLRRYMGLFETAFLIKLIPAWSVHSGKRLVKAQKLLLGDTGFMAYLLHYGPGNLLDDPRVAGRFLETFVGTELLKLCSFSERQPELLHYRTSGGAEVDFVLESGGRLIAGIEVKCSRTIRSSDFRGLQQLAEDAGERFVGGLLLYRGREIVPFGKNCWAAPVEALWG
jgi:predicted AAA+ superfamily ATPase